MRTRLFTVIGAAAIVAAVAVSVNVRSATTTGGPRTSWGEPDLQGIWTNEFDTPLQRAARYGTREFFTEEERAELDKERAGASRQRPAGRARHRARRRRRIRLRVHVDEAHRPAHLAHRRSAGWTRPPLVPEAAQRAAADREFRLALLQATETCKSNSTACAGGKYDPTPSARRGEALTRYNTARMNRHNGPEDGSLADRCLSGNIPEFGTAYGGSFRRIVQTPGGISIFYDVGQGQGFQRNIVMNGSPHLPARIQQWHGDSRGRWEGDTLVVDVTNFSPKTDFMGSRENLHLIERWTRTGPDTLEYAVTIEDPTVWTRPWTVKEEFTRQNDKENRIYYEPRCHEGNYGFPSLLLAARLADKAYAEGRGPHPATNDNATDFVGVEENPLAR